MRVSPDAVGPRRSRRSSLHFRGEIHAARSARRREPREGEDRGRRHPSRRSRRRKGQRKLFHGFHLSALQRRWKGEFHGQDLCARSRSTGIRDDGEVLHCSLNQSINGSSLEFRISGRSSESVRSEHGDETGYDRRGMDDDPLGPRLLLSFSSSSLRVNYEGVLEPTRAFLEIQATRITLRAPNRAW